MKYLFGLDKWATLIRMIRKNGGIRKSMYKMWRFDTLKEGTLKGVDQFGNKYYENNFYMLSRNRWVEYNDCVKWEYDGSQVTPEWFGWLHYKTDRIPSKDSSKVEVYSCPWVAGWLKPHEENNSANPKAYVPYSTVNPHIGLWDGCVVSERWCGCPCVSSGEGGDCA